MNELVSIVIPTYKGEESLARAIDSALSQTYEYKEIIVVDDNAPDSKERSITENIMSRYNGIPNLRYVKRDNNGGIAAAKNTGIKNSKGVYVSFLDDDDYYLEERLEKCVSYLSEHPDMIGVYTGVDVYNKDKKITLRLRPDKNLAIPDILLNEMAIGTGSNDFIRKDAIEKVCGHDETFLRRTDLEFMIRLCKIGEIGYITECLVIKDVNSTNTVPPYPKMKKTLKKYFNKFKDDIIALGPDKRLFFYRQYRALLGVAMRDRNPDEIKEAASLTRRYGKLGFKTSINVWLYIHGLRDMPLVLLAIKLKHRIFK